jgi:hypothetical protein
MDVYEGCDYLRVLKVWFLEFWLLKSIKERVLNIIEMVYLLYTRYT